MPEDQAVSDMIQRMIERGELDFLDRTEPLGEPGSMPKRANPVPAGGPERGN